MRPRLFLKANFMIDDAMIKRANRDPLDDAVDLASCKVVGSGISKTTRVALNLADHPGPHTQPRAPWSENRDMIVSLFTPTFERSHLCPGRDNPRCCQSSSNGQCCPTWVEREDPEWYALEINKYLSIVNGRLRQNTPVTAALAADEGFELGCLLTEALIKFRWDDHAQRGEQVVAGAKRGGDMRREANQRRRSVEATVAAVDALLEQGAAKKTAYSLVAVQQGVSDQTIAKEFQKAKNRR